LLPKPLKQRIEKAQLRASLAVNQELVLLYWQIGLNKGEQQNALRRALFFNRLGEIRDRSFENQRHRASGLNLLVAAIILWNTTYLQRAVDHLRNQGHDPAPGDLAHLSPLGWEHINLTGDYHWETSPTLGPDQFRPLRTGAHAAAAAA
jgi:hypothetical protein